MRPEEAPANGSPNEEVVRDVDQVIAGQILTHTFTIANTRDEPVSIQAKDDVRVGCGCAALEPAARTIPARGKTDVTLKVNTAGRNGRFTYGGSIVWTTASGETRAVSLALRGEVVAALQCDPSELDFSTEEVRAGTLKSVKVTSRVPVDWKTLSLSLGAGHGKVSNLRIDPQMAHFDVRCTVPSGLENVGDGVTIKADVSPSSPVLAGSTVTLTVPIRAHQLVDLTISPGVVPVAFRGEERRGTAKLMLRGKAVAQGAKAIRSVRCDGYEVDWSLKGAAGSQAGILELVFKAEETVQTRESELQIEVAGCGVVRVPVTRVRLKAGSK